jgi:ABC-type nitrate/sulfonate/bicarbonate transport system ATPase subunit
MTPFQYAIHEPILTVSGLSVVYDNPILRDVNFEIKNIVRPGLTQGQTIAILAPSGMGKTQLFRCIAGIQKPAAGTVTLTENNHPVSIGQVGVVAQDYPLFEHLTVFDNVLLGASLKEKDRAKAKEITLRYLERFGLVDRIGLYPQNISGGQRQRVAIIQQMVACGHTLLMDEPFSGLDILMKGEVQRLIQAVTAEHELNTVIFTTHDISAAITIADTILLLGHERDADGNKIPGANIRFRYDLIEAGLTWQPNIDSLPAFAAMEREIKNRFHEL